MGLFDGLKRMLGLDSNSGATNTNAVAEELPQEPKIVEEEPKPLPPSVNYTATEEAEELIRMWMTENNILNESFGEILHKLGFEKEHRFFKIGIPISSPYRKGDYLGAIGYSYYKKEKMLFLPSIDKLISIKLIFYKNSIIVLKNDEYKDKGPFRFPEKNENWTWPLWCANFCNENAEKLIISFDKKNNVVFQLILNGLKKEHTCDAYIDARKANKKCVFYTNIEMIRENEKTTIYGDFNNKKIIIEACKPYSPIIECLRENLIPSLDIACDVENSLPTYIWHNKNDFINYISSYLYLWDQDVKLRKEISFYGDSNKYNREKDINKPTDKFVITDALKFFFKNLNYDFSSPANSYQYHNYQTIKISTENNGEKCLELLYQNDDEKNEIRVIITNNKNELVRGCIAKNEDLDNNMTRRIIEVTDGTNKVALSVEGKNIKEMFDEVRLFLLLLDTFPINVNINWVWEAICNLSFRDIPNNYAKVQLSFYKDGELINKREFENNLFNKERGPVRSKNKNDVT